MRIILHLFESNCDNAYTYVYLNSEDYESIVFVITFCLEQIKLIQNNLLVFLMIIILLVYDSNLQKYQLNKKLGKF